MDIEQLRSEIRPLDLSAVPEHSHAERAYFHHYGIDAEQRFAGLTHYFGRFASAGYQIAAHYFEPQNPRGCCLIMHGYYDHAGLYRHLIDYALRRQLAVFIYDLPGHGLSSGAPATINSFAEYGQLLADAVQLLSARAPKPWYAIAQSTGAAILMDYLLHSDAAIFAHNILLAPLVRPVHWRKSQLSYYAVRLLLNSVPRRLAENSSDPVFVAFLRERDPLQSNRLPLRWVRALIHWIRHFERSEPRDCALQIIQGRQDKTVDWRYNIGAIEQKFPRARVHYLAGAHHHLANENSEILQQIFALLDDALGAPASPQTIDPAGF